MTPGEAAAAFEEAGLHAHLDRRDEAAADDGGRRAAERGVAAHRAAAHRDGDPYDLDADVVVQEELAEDRRREEAEQRQRQEQQQIAERADELAALAGVRKGQVC